MSGYYPQLGYGVYPAQCALSQPLYDQPEGLGGMKHHLAVPIGLLKPHVLGTVNPIQIGTDWVARA